MIVTEATSYKVQPNTESILALFDFSGNFGFSSNGEKEETRENAPSFQGNTYGNAYKDLLSQTSEEAGVTHKTSY
ncbi:MAG: hypothetical protein WCS37_00885 [Chloroflexota bacterium]|nr:hypothetical protein [Chloroflexota bacterium]